MKHLKDTIFYTTISDNFFRYEMIPVSIAGFLDIHFYDTDIYNKKIY